MGGKYAEKSKRTIENGTSIYSGRISNGGQNK